MTEKLPIDSDQVRSPDRAIRSINKKSVLIVLLLAFSALVLIIYLIPSSPKDVSANTSKSAGIFGEAGTFPELQQLPESYDGLESVQTMPVQEPIQRQFKEPEERGDFRMMEPNPVDSEQEAAKKSPVLFNSDRQDHREVSVAYPQDFSDTKPSKSNLLFSQKEQFLQGSGTGPGTLKKTASRFSIASGTLIPAVLLSAINSDLPGPVLAQVTSNVYNTTTGKHLLIPQGTKIVGDYNSSVSNGQQRAQVVWSKLILPNGNSMDLGRMPSLDGTGASGHQGTVNNHYDKLALGVLVTSLLSSGVGMSSGSASPGAASPQQIIGQSVGQEVARVGTKMAERSLDVPATILVKSGTRINVFSMSDLELIPYKF